MFEQTIFFRWNVYCNQGIETSRKISKHSTNKLGEKFPICHKRHGNIYQGTDTKKRHEKHQCMCQKHHQKTSKCQETSQSRHQGTKNITKNIKVSKNHQDFQIC